MSNESKETKKAVKDESKKDVKEEKKIAESKVTESIDEEPKKTLNEEEKEKITDKVNTLSNKIKENGEKIDEEIHRHEVMEKFKEFQEERENKEEENEIEDDDDEVEDEFEYYEDDYDEKYEEFKLAEKIEKKYHEVKTRYKELIQAEISELLKMVEFSKEAKALANKYNVTPNNPDFNNVISYLNRIKKNIPEVPEIRKEIINEIYCIDETIKLRLKNNCLNNISGLVNEKETLNIVLETIERIETIIFEEEEEE